MFGRVELQRHDLLLAGRVGDAAIRTDPADQPLRDDRQQAAGELVAGDAEIVEVADRARRVGAVERAEDQDAGQRGADADPGRLVVADLADHDDVRILAKHRAEALAEAHLSRGDLGLVDARDAMLDRVLDRHDILHRRVDPLEAVIQRRGLAGADGAGTRTAPYGWAISRSRASACSAVMPRCVKPWTSVSTSWMRTTIFSPNVVGKVARRRSRGGCGAGS